MCVGSFLYMSLVRVPPHTHSKHAHTYMHTYTNTYIHIQAYRHAKIREAVVVDSYDHPEYDAWVGGSQVRD